MTKRDSLMEKFKNNNGIWVDYDDLLLVIPDQVKLDRAIKELNQDGWGIKSKSMQREISTKDGVRLKNTTVYMYTTAGSANGWTCTGCDDVYTNVVDGTFGVQTLDPRYSEASCRRCKKKTYWRKNEN